MARIENPGSRAGHDHGRAHAAVYSFVLRGYIRHWLAQVWLEYHRIGLLNLVGEHTAAAAVRKFLVSA